MNEIKQYCVYVHTFPKGEKYVGITSRQPELRWMHGRGYWGQWVYSAVEKYGWDNIAHDVVAVGLNEADARRMEHLLIDKYHSWCPGYGYNDVGGNGSRSPYHPVLDSDDNRVYATVAQAAELTGITRYAITESCHGRGKLIGRFRWYGGEIGNLASPAPLPAQRQPHFQS